MLHHNHPFNDVGLSKYPVEANFVPSSVVDVASPLSLTKGLFVGAFLVSGPVVLQAPLVRAFPLFSLSLTAVLWLVAGALLQRPPLKFYGDLLFGFSWSWLAGAIYWGWLRWEPIWHLPVEALGLPFALFAIWRGWLVVGQCFYLGSLLGTAVTDVYFYCLDLLPFWRRIMAPDVQQPLLILRDAGMLVKTWDGFFWALLLVLLLCLVAGLALRTKLLHWWVFSGAVLGTLFVDALFGASALL